MPDKHKIETHIRSRGRSQDPNTSPPGSVPLSTWLEIVANVAGRPTTHWWALIPIYPSICLEMISYILFSPNPSWIQSISNNAALCSVTSRICPLLTTSVSITWAQVNIVPHLDYCIRLLISLSVVVFYTFLHCKLFWACQPSWFLKKLSQIMSLRAQILQGLLISLVKVLMASTRLQVIWSPVVSLIPSPMAMHLFTQLHFIESSHSASNMLLRLFSLHIPSCWSAVLSDMSILFVGLFQAFIPMQLFQWGSLPPTI